MADAIDLFKYHARRIRKATGVQLSTVQEQLSKALRYQNFHECRLRLMDQRGNQVRDELEAAEKLLILQHETTGVLDGSKCRPK